MFTTFRENQERYTQPPPPERSNSGAGNVIFLEDGDTLPPYQELYSLTLTWDDIANVPVNDAYNISEWNTFFQLNKNNLFELIDINGNTVMLKTPHQISLADGLFSNIDNPSSLLSVIDEGCIVSIGNNVFDACYNITSINFPSLITAGDYCFYAYSLTSINLPKLQTAGIGCFEYFYGTSINFLPSLITAGNNCFGECDNLISINLPSLVTAGNSCFLNCAKLTSINLPSLVTAGNFCFQDCTGLTSINLPSLVTAGNSCFNNCANLISINMLLLVTAGSSCFYDCYKLRFINLPSLITAGRDCFGLGEGSGLYTYNLPKLQTVDDFCFAAGLSKVLNIYAPSLLRLGSTVGNNGVFRVSNIIVPEQPPRYEYSTNVTITIPAALMTCNGGQPDGDIQFAQSRGICNVTTV